MRDSEASLVAELEAARLECALRLEVAAALRLLAKHANLRGGGPALMPVTFRFIPPKAGREVLVPVAAIDAKLEETGNGG